MKRLVSVVVIGAMVMGMSWTVPLLAKTLFHDNFNAATLDKIWLTDHKQAQTGVAKPKWVLANGILSQTNPQPGDPTYALIQGTGWPEELGIMAKVRIDEWKDHDLSRAGVGLWNDPADNYNAYTWLIHERLTDKNMEFLNDRRAWFQQEAIFPVTAGKWYRMKMVIDKAKVYGKIWADGTPEPKDWLASFEWAKFGGPRKPTSFAGLNGGAANAGGGHSSASFDDVNVFDSGGPDVIAVEPKGKLAISWAALKQ